MTLEDLIAEAHSLGFQFNNLIELPDGVWRCNLRHKGTAVCHAWARGTSAADAVDRALRVHRGAVPWEARPASVESLFG